MRFALPSFISKWNFRKTLIISGIIFGIGLFCEFLTPELFEAMVKKRINVAPNSDLREFYVKVPFFLNFKIYMFNLTNPEEVTQGGKAKLQEVGPYFFEEWKEKFDLVDDEAEDTLRYHFKNTFKFRPDLSGPGLTGNEIITMPHPLLATMVFSVNVDKKPILPMITSAINTIFKSPNDMFWTGRVMDALFDGIPVDCSNTEDFGAKAVCGAFKSGDVNAVQPHNDTHYQFTLLQAVNGTDIGEFTVFRGKKNASDIGKVVAFNGEAEQDVWDGDECNQYMGTDSTIFPPYMDVNDGIWAWDPSVCRSMRAHYVGKSNYMGIETAEFAMDFTSSENGKECFCRDPDECPKKGTFDLFPCIGAPMIGSQPHFWGADPSLLDHFESGIHPNKEDHSIYAHVETITGTPLKGVRRLQFNLEIVPIEVVPFMANLREMYYPMFWVEEGVELNKTFTDQLRNSVILANKLQSFLKWAGLIFGGIGLLLSATLLYSKSITLPISEPKAEVPSIKKFFS